MGRGRERERGGEREGGREREREGGREREERGKTVGERLVRASEGDNNFGP
jgi:hypothetical protein